MINYLQQHSSSPDKCAEGTCGEHAGNYIVATAAAMAAAFLHACRVHAQQPMPALDVSRYRLEPPPQVGWISSAATGLLLCLIATAGAPHMEPLQHKQSVAGQGHLAEQGSSLLSRHASEVFCSGQQRQLRTEASRYRFPTISRLHGDPCLSA